MAAAGQGDRLEGKKEMRERIDILVDDGTQFLF
jgi:hypothetical protein